MPPDFLLTHASRKAAVIYLLQRYPAGVTRNQLQEYWYRTRRGRVVKLDWEARNALAEARHEYHIAHITLEGQSAWVLRGPKREASGQLILGWAG